MPILNFGTKILVTSDKVTVHHRNLVTKILCFYSYIYYLLKYIKSRNHVLKIPNIYLDLCDLALQ